MTFHTPLNPSSYLFTLCNPTDGPCGVALATWATQKHRDTHSHTQFKGIQSCPCLLMECGSHWSSRRACLGTGSSREACSGRRRDPPHEACTHRSPAVGVTASSNQSETRDCRFGLIFKQALALSQHPILQAKTKTKSIWYTLEPHINIAT